MDQLAERINRTGVAGNISSHLMWRSVADQAISDYRRDAKPIAVVGHSIGGDAAVEFAERLEATHVPVSLLVTYDPNRFAHSVPSNIRRTSTSTSRPTCWVAATLRRSAEVIHVNLDKFPHIQEILASKIRSAGAISEAREPLRLVVPSGVPIELWNGRLAISAHGGDSLRTIATTYHMPLWT